LAYKVGRAGQRVRLSASGLTVAEAGGREAVDGHVDQALDSRVLDHVRLASMTKWIHLCTKIEIPTT
jgi:hypothetical protein